MNRGDFQRLAEIRIREAQALLAATEWAGAYYLAGYAIECALKACIAKRTNQFDFPDKRLAEKSYSHNLKELLVPAALAKELQDVADGDVDFAANWETVVQWSEQMRYEFPDEQKARDIVDAIDDPSKGVLPWLRTLW